MDNHATHKTDKVRNWFAHCSHWHVHFTPTLASWLNQVERWFPELPGRRCSGACVVRSRNSMWTSCPSSACTTRNRSPTNGSSRPPRSLSRSGGCASRRKSSEQAKKFDANSGFWSPGPHRILESSASIACKIEPLRQRRLSSADQETPWALTMPESRWRPNLTITVKLSSGDPECCRNARSNDQHEDRLLPEFAECYRCGGVVN